MLVFLEMNGWRVAASDPEPADWILSFSAGTSPEEIAAAPQVRDAAERVSRFAGTLPMESAGIEPATSCLQNRHMGCALLQ